MKRIPRRPLTPAELVAAVAEAGFTEVPDAAVLGVAAADQWRAELRDVLEGLGNYDTLDWLKARRDLRRGQL